MGHDHAQALWRFINAQTPVRMIGLCLLHAGDGLVQGAGLTRLLRLSGAQPLLEPGVEYQARGCNDDDQDNLLNAPDQRRQPQPWQSQQHEDHRQKR